MAEASQRVLNTSLQRPTASSSARRLPTTPEPGGVGPAGLGQRSKREGQPPWTPSGSAQTRKSQQRSTTPPPPPTPPAAQTGSGSHDNASSTAWAWEDQDSPTKLPRRSSTPVPGGGGGGRTTPTGVRSRKVTSSTSMGPPESPRSSRNSLIVPAADRAVRQSRSPKSGGGGRNPCKSRGSSVESSGADSTARPARTDTVSVASTVMASPRGERPRSNVNCRNGQSDRPLSARGVSSAAPPPLQDPRDNATGGSRGSDCDSPRSLRRAPASHVSERPSIPASASRHREGEEIEELCRSWEEWSQGIVRAIEGGSELPEPPRPPHGGGNVPSSLIRVLEASIIAAAALARSSAETEGLRIVANSLDSQLARSRTDVRSLQDALNDMTEERVEAERKLASRCEELQNTVKVADEDARRLRRRTEELQASLDTARKQAESERRRLDDRPCRRCADLEQRLREVDENVMEARSRLSSSELLRQKEVEDAWCAAKTSESKHRHTLAVLRDLLNSQNSGKGDLAAVLSSCSPQSVEDISDKVPLSRVLPAQVPKVVPSVEGRKSSRHAVEQLQLPLPPAPPPAHEKSFVSPMMDSFVNSEDGGVWDNMETPSSQGRGGTPTFSDGHFGDIPCNTRDRWRNDSFAAGKVGHDSDADLIRHDAVANSLAEKLISVKSRGNRDYSKGCMSSASSNARSPAGCEPEEEDQGDRVDRASRATSVPESERGPMERRPRRQQGRSPSSRKNLGETQKLEFDLAEERQQVCSDGPRSTLPLSSALSRDASEPQPVMASPRNEELGDGPRTSLISSGSSCGGERAAVRANRRSVTARYSGLALGAALRGMFGPGGSDRQTMDTQ
eukprot:TRINITY_DN26715_c0_g1_i1.p1 TRINITY_DN26715_c0_g1~~TRINITY_DN26715_c0_g1_i1.p1  ORF type:complete len:849 (+),score=132.76 TRINITY_DN26715_c0_g1_i1:354-2900(+)